MMRLYLMFVTAVCVLSLIKLYPHMASGRNGTRTTLVGEEHSHHCATPAPHVILSNY